MRKYVALLAVLLSLNLFAAEDKECVCFELKGKFGEEIRAILEKYTKNLGDDQIRVVTEDSYQAEESKSITDSVLGIFSPEESVAKQAKGKDLTEVASVYERDCATCHGIAGSNTESSRAISSMDADSIFDVLITYHDGTYKGPSRFVKKTAVQTLSFDDLKLLSHYITTLKTDKPKKEEKK